MTDRHWTTYWPSDGSGRNQEWWDRWFLDLAKQVSTASKDPRTQVGSVIVRPDKTIAGIGYNGFPRNIEDDHRLNDRPTKLKYMIHAEVNAILNAKESVEGFTIYVWPFLPCISCAGFVIQSGIARVVAPEIAEENKENWGAILAEAQEYLQSAGVQTTEIKN